MGAAGFRTSDLSRVKSDRTTAAYCGPSLSRSAERLRTKLQIRSPSAPFCTRVRSFTVANADSIGFVVRRWRQCSAGKSYGVKVTDDEEVETGERVAA